MRNLIRGGLGIFAALSLCALVGGCTHGPQRGVVQLFPANDAAAALGVVTGEYVTNGAGNGSLRIQMPDGEILTGQYSIVQGGTLGAGSIFASVYGDTGMASGFATGSASTAERVSPGMASLFGDKGTSMQCEFRNDNVTHHGFGGCRTSKGALFRAQF